TGALPPQNIGIVDVNSMQYWMLLSYLPDWVLRSILSLLSASVTCKKNKVHNPKGMVAHY
ncbi:hypothetical protein, partial [Lacrimispora sp.]|uniref:hypothetical protein n=1 Tax=Lacrimispora sp. TaxID=2719234 RepID=UPI0032E3E494